MKGAQNLLKITSLTPPPLYQLLANNIKQPLIVISNTYDTLLEDTFTNVGKKYVLISPCIATNKNNIQIIVKYSDKDKPEFYDFEESLSTLKPLEKEYSLIYKIRGYFDTRLDKQENQLILTEENYFAFAYHRDKLIPNYLIGKYADLGFLFLGYTPKQWEDRLMVDAIWKKHDYFQKNEPSFAIRQNTEPYEIEYWKSCNIRMHEVELTEFVQKLQEHL